MSVIEKQARTKKPVREEIVPEGYKRTEVGVIPEDWDCKNLGDLVLRIGSGITPTGGERVYVKEGRPFIRSQNVGWGTLVLEDLVYISDEIHFTFPASEIKQGDVLLNITGASIGRSAVADERIAGGNVNQHVCEIRPDTKKLNSYFLNAFLISEIGQQQIDSFQAGGNRQGLNYQQIRSFVIPLPSLSEQRAIAEALSDVDGLIAALDKLIAKKKATKQAAMQQLLTGKVRLPGFSGEWEVKRLGEIGDCLRGVSYNGQQDLVEGDTEGSIRLLRANNISEGTINLKDLQYVKAHAVFETQILKNNDIIICMANGSKELVGKAALFKSIDSFPYTFGAFMGCFRIKSDKANPNFIFGLFNSQRYRRYLKVLLSGSSINNLKPSDIESMEFKIPSDRIEQDSIASVLSDMEFEIQALERRREKVKQIKQGMMQQLLTGRVRLIKQKKYTNKVAKRTASKKPHSDAFNEAIIISVLAKHFSSEKRVMGRKRYTKLSYLLHRYTDNKIEDYLKKAAGPYNPKTKYKGAEKIALEKGYVRKLTDDDYSGFIAGENIEQAEKYFEKWYGHECIDWLKQFKYKKTEELELITTVDMAIIELQNAGKKVDLESVKKVIRSYPEWKRKLERPIFSDKNILNAIALIQTLFSERKK